ncbi:MAG: GAF domain-containing sensor histidine kinase [Armatimonadota bacterium]|nr:GAF domain-containing sensor histidine kinase [Armatimonadota bacterium]
MGEGGAAANLSELSWTLNVAALGIGAHVAVALFLALRYLETRRGQDGLWALAYGMLTVHEVVEVLLVATPWWLLARHVLVLVPGIILLGSFPANRAIVARAAAASAAAAAAAWPLAAAGRTWPWAAVPASAAAGVLFIAVARSSRRAAGEEAGMPTHLIAWGFALTGWLQLAYPFLRPAAWGTLAGGLLAGAFTLMLGVGLVVRTWHDTRELELMSAIARVLNRFRDTREALAETLRLLVSLLGVEGGWVFLRERDRFVVAASCGLPAALAADGSARMSGECRCLNLLAANQLPLAVNIIDCQRLAGAGIPGRHASVPLRASQSTVGLMNLVLPGGRSFDARQLQMLSAVGQQVGLAIERGLLFEDVAAKERTRGELIEKLLTAHEDERRRIARELHDEAGQALTALIVNLELASQESSPERLRGQLGQLRDLAERTLGEIRRVIYDLRPSILDDLGLAAALRWYAKNLLDPRGIAWTLSVSGISGRLPAGLETVAFRLVQEALTNVLRHAEASKVTVSVAAVGRELHVRIEDNGRGFDARRPRSADRTGGFGLLGMQERVELVGGRWEVQSTPGVGTVVSATLPIRDET